MASLASSTVQDFLRFTIMLARAGLSVQDVQDINQKPQLAHAWIEHLHTLRLPAKIFQPAGALLDSVGQRIQQAGWPFGAEDIERLRATIPVFASHGLTALSLDIWLGDLAKTFRQLWDWVRHTHGLSERREVYASGDRFRQLDPGRYTSRPRIEWAVVDLAANWNRQTGLSPLSVRNSVMSPGLEVLAAAALHPKWIQHMDGDTVPYVWLPGLQVNFPARRPGADVPCLHRQYGTLLLEVKRGYERREDFAVPELIEI